MVSSVRDLGVTITDVFTPSANIVIATQRARTMMFLIRRSFCHITPDILIPLYSCFVRVHLEYAIQATRPFLKKDLDRVEKIQ